MRAFVAIVHKELKLLYADPATLVLLLFMPFVLVAVLSTAFEPLVVGRPQLELSVIDLDRTAASQELAAGLAEVDGLDVRVEERPGTTISADEVQELFGEERFAALVIPAGFEVAVQQGSDVTLTLHGDPARAGYVDIVQEQIEGQLLVAQLAEGLIAIVSQATGATEAEAQTTVLRAASSAAAAVESGLETVPVSARDTFPTAFEQTVPGFAVMFGFFVAYAIAINFIQEKSEFHTWRRTLVAPVSRATIVSARVAAYVLLGTAQLAIMLVLGWAIWGMSLGSSPLALVLAISLWALVSATFGAMIASLLDDLVAVSALISISVIVLGAVSGALIPVAFLPEWMRFISVATPQFWAVDAIQELIVRGRGLADILSQLAILLAFAAAFLAVALRPRPGAA